MHGSAESPGLRRLYSSLPYFWSDLEPLTTSNPTHPSSLHGTGQTQWPNLRRNPIVGDPKGPEVTYLLHGAKSLGKDQ